MWVALPLRMDTEPALTRSNLDHGLDLPQAGKG